MDASTLPLRTTTGTDWKHPSVYVDHATAPRFADVLRLRLDCGAEYRSTVEQLAAAQGERDRFKAEHDAYVEDWKVYRLWIAAVQSAWFAGLTGPQCPVTWNRETEERCDNLSELIRESNRKVAALMIQCEMHVAAYHARKAWKRQHNDPR